MILTEAQAFSTITYWYNSQIVAGSDYVTMGEPQYISLDKLYSLALYCRVLNMCGTVWPSRVEPATAVVMEFEAPTEKGSEHLKN